MAIFHLSVKTIGRAQGRSATAAAAYRAATRIEDERTGLLHDYSRKGGVLHREIVVPDDAPAWARDRAQLWNAAELAETRKNSTVAREFEVALPGELQRDAQQRLACALAQEITARHKCAVDVAIHAPSRRGDLRNDHAHLLLTTRRLTTDGFTEKTRELDDLKSGEVLRWRERWAALVNQHLAEHGRAERIDHRSLAEQGEVREPTFHKGPAVTAIERRAERSFVVERTREEVTERLQHAAELGRLERESQHLARSIIDTTTELKAALAARDQTPRPSLEQTRREAQAAWLASRAARGDARPSGRQRRAGARPGRRSCRRPSRGTRAVACGARGRRAAFRPGYEDRPGCAAGAPRHHPARRRSQPVSGPDPHPGRLMERLTDVTDRGYTWCVTSSRGRRSMPIDSVDALGFCAGALTTASFLPQVVKSWSTRDLSGISLRMYSLFTAGVALWLLYGLLVANRPIVFWNAVTLLLAGTVLVLKLRHR